MSVYLLPLFPLPLVLFPGAPLPLHIFEPRYRQMLSDCIARDSRFGIIYRPEDETDLEAGRVGCVAQVDDFLRRILGETGARPRSPAARASRRLLADLQSLTITDVLDQGLHEFLMDVQASLSSISDAVVETTMFYPAESVLEEQQQQQQQ